MLSRVAARSRSYASHSRFITLLSSDRFFSRLHRVTIFATKGHSVRKARGRAGGRPLRGRAGAMLAIGAEQLPPRRTRKNSARVDLANYVRSRRRCAAIIVPYIRGASLVPSPPSVRRVLSFLITFHPLLHARALVSLSYVAPSLSRARCLSPSWPRETPRCVSTIFKRHGPSARVAQPLYIKRQGGRVLRRLLLALCEERRRASSVAYTREDPLRNRYRVVAPFLTFVPLSPSSFVLRSPAFSLHPSPPLSPPAFSPSPCSSSRFLLSPVSPSSTVALLHPRGTSDGRWLRSCVLLSLKVTRSSLGAISSRFNHFD